jgi:hypothetical protein
MIIQTPIMKKLFSGLALLFILSYGARAQYCYSPDSIFMNEPLFTNLGFFGPSDSIACLTAGAYINDTIYFTTPTTISGFQIDTLTIDSIGNLPVSLCWVSNKPSNSFGAGEVGAILLNGRSSSPPGQYKLQIFIGVAGPVLNLSPYTNAETAMQLRCYLRIDCPGAACPPSDTTLGKDSFYISYASQIPCTLGITEVNSNISQLSIVPNPFNTSTLVSFYADIAEVNTIRLTDLLGNIVITKETTVIPGSNQITIDKGGLATGMYLLSILSQAGTTTRKVIVE